MIMDKGRHVLTLVVILVSLMLIDEGKAIMLAGDDIQIHLNNDQNKGIETPYQYSFYRTSDDATWNDSNSCELSCSSEKLLFFSRYSILRTMDFAGFVWQPPETVSEQLS
jgi:hypothetical protein